jgi:hypothetical protein
MITPLQINTFAYAEVEATGPSTVDIHFIQSETTTASDYKAITTGSSYFSNVTE